MKEQQQQHQQHGTVMLWDVIAKDRTVVIGSLQPQSSLFLAAAAAACDQHVAVLAASRSEHDGSDLVPFSVQLCSLIMSWQQHT